LAGGLWVGGLWVGGLLVAGLLGIGPGFRVIGLNFRRWPWSPVTTSGHWV